MSLIWKVTIFLALAAVIQASSLRHSTHLGIVNPIDEVEDTVHVESKSLGVESFTEHLFWGKIDCNGVPADGVRPFLQSPWYNNAIEVITTTKNGGLYKLYTTEIFNGHRSVRLTVRHQCPQENIPLQSNCAIPMYWTEYALPNDRLSVTFNFDLAKMEQYTRAECLN